MELSDYRRKGFLPFCMEEIRLAFSNGIDPQKIEQYMNDTAFDNMQLRQIRLGLEQDLDVSAYARTSMPYEEMEKIRERLLKEQSERDLDAEALFPGRDCYSLEGGYIGYVRYSMANGSDSGEKQKKAEESIQKKYHKQLFTPFAKAFPVRHPRDR